MRSGPSKQFLYNMSTKYLCDNFQVVLQLDFLFGYTDMPDW